MTSSSVSRRLRLLVVCTFMTATASQAMPTTAFAQRSAADIESARQLYNEGIGLRDKGDSKGALEKFRAAHALGNTPLTGIELCKMHALLAQPVEAREVCLGVARIPPLAGETSRSQDARNEAARVAEEMKPRISSVRLQVTGVPRGREPIVIVDGARVPNAALGELRAVNPGRHDVVAKIGRGPETRTSIEVAPGESKIVSLPVQAPPEEATPLPVGPGQGPGYDRPPRQRSNGLATAGFIVGGIGVGVGAITGIVALSQKSDLDATCTRKVCGPEDHDTLDTAKRWGTVSTAMFVIGGVGLVTGLVATLAAPKSPAASAAPARATRSAAASLTVTPDFGPGGVGFHGAF
jgi:hypothetical protein